MSDSEQARPAGTTERETTAPATRPRPGGEERRLREAEVELDDGDFAAMGIEGLLELFRDAGIRAFEELVCRGDGAVVQVEVDRRVEEATLSALDPVEGWTYVTGSEGDHVYVVEFTAPELPESLAGTFENLVGNCDPDLDDRGASMSLVGPQDAISAAVEGYRRAGTAPQLRRLGGYDGGTVPMDALTDRQREVVRTAWDLGHYEVPSEASTADVAAALDLDPSTVAEHLQRAERNLLGNHLP